MKRPSSTAVRMASTRTGSERPELSSVVPRGSSAIVVRTGYPSSSNPSAKLHVVQEAKQAKIQEHKDESESVLDIRAKRAQSDIRFFSMILWFGIGVLSVILIGTLMMIILGAPSLDQQLPASVQRARFYR